MTLSDLNASWDRGIHAILGAPTDGGPLLLSLLAGAERPRQGQIRVLDGDPLETSIRSQIAFVPLHPVLPDALRVREILALARRIRGDARGPGVSGLSVLEIESLAPRLARTLGPGEGRAVLLAEAIASPRVRVLLIEEPGVRLEPRAARRLGGVLREFARDGRVVLVVTSSARDADALADDTWQLRAGCLLPPCSPAASLGLEPSATGINLHLVVSDPRALTAALARESDVEGVTYDDAGLRVHGSNAIALAEAIGRTVAATEVVVFELRMEGGDATSPYRPRDTAGATDRPGREFT
jgi:ABC-type multidrug transport system ATPase subunit